MIYTKEIPSTDKELSEKLISEGWKKLKEPSSLGKAMLFSIPFIFINGFISIIISLYLYTPLKEFLASGISIMPFILLSVVLPFILKFLGLLNGYTIFLCLLNAMGSCVDFLTAFLVTIQVPNGSYIINNGFEAYFK